MVEQPRVPAGRFLWELPAGMLENKTLKGAMFDEIREETGIVVSEDRLLCIGKNVFSSSGILDEEFTVFSAYCPEMVDAVPCGNYEEDEIISKVQAFPIKNIPMDDGKVGIALSFADRMKLFEKTTSLFSISE